MSVIRSCAGLCARMFRQVADLCVCVVGVCGTCGSYVCVCFVLVCASVCMRVWCSCVCCVSVWCLFPGRCACCVSVVRGGC